MGVGLDPTKSTKVWSVNGANDKGVKVVVHDQCFNPSQRLFLAAAGAQRTTCLYKIFYKKNFTYVNKKAKFCMTATVEISAQIFIIYFSADAIPRF